MSYDPFSRGLFPVGVRTVSAHDGGRNRLLPIEIWYPADAVHAGQDLAEETRDRFDVLPGFSAAWQEAVRDAAPRSGRFPLVAFSHGYGGHRRQSTFFCTHLASHGYVVAAVEHTGNTVIDVMQAVLSYQAGSPPADPLAAAREFITLRPADVSFLLDQVLDGAAGDVGTMIDAERIGMTGHSFGGWTTLTVTARDVRVRAALPLAPAGGSVAFGKNPFRETVDFKWSREVPTLFLVAERDTLLPLDGMQDLLGRTPSRRKAMAVLKNADHMHFCDQAEQTHEMFRLMPPPPEFAAIVASVPPFSELCPAVHGYDFVRGLGLAHMDAHLKEDESASEFLAGDLRAACAARGFSVDVCR